MRDPQPLDFYFDYISPYGWIAAELVGDLARRHGRQVVWRPFLLKATVVEVMGLPPILQTPLKGAYALHDVFRLARFHGLEIAANARLNFSSLLAARATIWVARSANHLIGDFVLMLYRRHWAEGDDISDEVVVLDVGAQLGLDVAALRAGVADPVIKSEFKAAVEAAIARGVFGSPTIIVDGEMFWGSDRLSQVSAWLETGGW